MGARDFANEINDLEDATNCAFLATNGVDKATIKAYIGNMKNGKITRADGSVIEWVETAPNTFRLTKDGKPFNVCDEIVEGIENDDDE